MKITNKNYSFRLPFTTKFRTTLTKTQCVECRQKKYKYSSVMKNLFSSNNKIKTRKCKAKYEINRIDDVLYVCSTYYEYNNA